MLFETATKSLLTQGNTSTRHNLSWLNITLFVRNVSLLNSFTEEIWMLE